MPKNIAHPSLSDKATSHNLLPNSQEHAFQLCCDSQRAKTANKRKSENPVPTLVLKSIFSAMLATALGSMAAADVPVVPRGQTFTCTPTHVWDGDGPIWCREGPRLRLAGIAARELDGSCSSGHPCPTPSGIESRDALVNLLGTPTGISRYGHIIIDALPLRCRSDGSAGGTRTASWCISPRYGDVNCAMVAGGWALPWNKYWRDHRC